MFSWLEEIERKTFKTVLQEHNSLKIGKMQINHIPTEINELGQIFTAASYFLSENNMVQLPASNPTALNFILNDIAPHFKNVKAGFRDNHIEVVMMQYLKESSRQMFQGLVLKGMYPVVSDLFRRHGMKLLSPHKPRRTMQRFKVKRHSIEPLQLPDTSSIQQFVESAYFSKGDVLRLAPTGWKLVDELNHSITLRTFYSFVPDLELVVDTDDRTVVGIELHP